MSFDALFPSFPLSSKATRCRTLALLQLQTSATPTEHGLSMGKMGLLKAAICLPLLVRLLASTAKSEELPRDDTEKPLVGDSHFDKAACPDYAHYAAYPQ